MKKNLTTAILVLWAVSLFAQSDSQPLTTKSKWDVKSWNKLNTAFTEPAFQSSYDRLNRNMEIKLDSIVIGAYYSDENYWDRTGKYECIYNDQNQIVIENYYSIVWGSINLSSKNLYTYNSNGDWESVTSVVWDEMSQIMRNVSKSVYFYDENRRLDSVSIYFGNESNSWYKAAKVVSYYDSDNRITEQIYFVLVDDVYQEYRKMQYVYNGEDIISQIESILEGDRVRYIKCDFLYEDGRLMGWEKSGKVDDVWHKWYRRSFEYDQQGNVDAVKDYYIEGGHESLEEETSFTYNTTYPIEKVIVPSRFWLRMLDAPIQYCISETEYKNKTYEDFGYVEKTRFYYSPVSTVSVPKLEKHSPQISLYPNPADQYVHIKTDLDSDIVCELYDLAGRKVMNTSISGNGFSVEGIEPGIYVYKLIAGSHVESGKLIIR